MLCLIYTWLRTSKTVDGATTYYVYDGENIIAEISDSDTTVYLRDNVGIISRTRGNAKEYFVSNYRGDTTAVVNANSDILKSYEYDAFGNIKNPTSADDNPFRYCGEYFDDETGFVYLRNRYYDPSIGRFTTEDPAKSGLNWYAYCENNPVKYIDPWGLDAIVANQMENVAKFGHMSSFVQDDNGIWYFFYWGKDSVSLKEVDDSSILNDSKKINKWLKDEGLNDGEYKYDGFCYILGDFSDSKEYYQELAQQFEDDVKNGDLGWFKWKNKNYNLATRNCTQETMKGLYKGRIGPEGEKTVEQVHHRAGYIIAVVPNCNLSNLQEVYGSRTLNWWE